MSLLAPTSPAHEDHSGFDFSQADQVPPARFNRVLWTGMMGDKPYPAFRHPFSLQ